MGGASRARRARAIWADVLLAPVLWVCAHSPLEPLDGGYHNARHGYWIGNPPAADPPWQREEVAGSLLSFRGSGAARMTFSSRCGEPLPRTELLARHLRIGIPASVVRQAGPVANGALEGWQQVFDADAVHVKTVTFSANGCALDWVLVARDAREFENALPDLDAWWRTLAVEPQTGSRAATASDGEPPKETP